MNQTTQAARRLSRCTKPAPVRVPDILATEKAIARRDSGGQAELRPPSEGHIVVTSVRQPTEPIRAFLRHASWRTTLVADLKTPAFDPLPRLAVLSVASQRRQWPEFALQLPWRHYARKNLGYLHAIKAGARVLFDTDDDNAPLEPWTPCPPREPAAVAATPGSAWVNVYAHFGARHVWPRGYPLEQIGRCAPPATVPTQTANVVVWQGLVAGDPDVDAIFRLTRCDPVSFQSAAPLVLPAGSYCPFNSQNTWWRQEAFSYLYLPATVTFRFTDILRSLVAQRCFWAHGWRLGFHGPTARQERNPHDLLADFRDELPGYLDPARIVARLEALSLADHPATNLRLCYAALADGGWVKPAELGILEGWLETLNAARSAESTDTP